MTFKETRAPVRLVATVRMTISAYMGPENNATNCAIASSVSYSISWRSERY